MNIILKSIVGKVREKDEDSVLGLSTAVSSQGSSSEMAILALADGMGGGSAGEVASGILIASVKEHLAPLLLRVEAPSESEVEEKIRGVITDANKKIADYGAKEKLQTIGTTAVIAFIDGPKALIGSVGDSRMYFSNRLGITQVTRDHSVVQQLFEQGVISKDEMRTHPQKNLITKAVGLEKDISPDIYRYKIFRNDLLLLCCDGLWEAMPERDMQKILLTNSPENSIDALIDTANLLDGSDNISAVLGVPTMIEESNDEYVQLVTRRVG